MNIGPRPLHATITGGTITTDNLRWKNFTSSISDYLGDPLFCKAFISGSTLVILIDKDGPSVLGPFPPDTLALHVSITVKSQTSTATWGGELPTPYTGAKLDFAIQVSPDLRFVSFVIRPRASAVHGSSIAAPGGAASPNLAAGDNDATLGYIVIEVDGQPGIFQLFFLDNPPTITNFPRLKTATIIPPSQPPGSIGGPMGVGLSS